MTKVPAHVELGASLTADQRRKARGNAAADEEAKTAAARQPRAARREQGEWDNDWSDAVVTAKLIAALAKLWPAARAPGGRPPSARIAESEGRAERKRAERDEAKRRREANWATHIWANARGPRRCHFCKVLARHRGAAEERECPRSLPQWTEVAVRESESGTSGHRLLIGLVERQRDPPSAFLMCERCGGFGEVKQSSLLAGQCRGRPSSASAAYSIQPLGNGQFPRPGAASVGTVVAQVYTVSKMRTFLAP